MKKERLILILILIGVLAIFIYSVAQKESSLPPPPEGVRLGDTSGYEEAIKEEKASSKSSELMATPPQPVDPYSGERL